MEFQNPVVAYTALDNNQAHVIADMLQNAGVPAYAVEDQSGASLFSFGIISQFHQPNVWVDQSTFQQAKAILAEFDRKRTEAPLVKDDSPIDVECEDCGKTVQYPAELDGTTQDCKHCGAFVDVGALGWEEEDWGEPEG